MLNKGRWDINQLEGDLSLLYWAVCSHTEGCLGIRCRNRFEALNGGGSPLCRMSIL